MRDFLAIVGSEEHKKNFLCMIYRAQHTLNGKTDWQYLIFRKQRKGWDEARALGPTFWIKPEPPKHYGCLVLAGDVPAQKLIDAMLTCFPTVYFHNIQTSFTEVARSKTVMSRGSLDGVLKDLQIIAARLYTVGTDLNPNRILQDCVFDPTVFSDLHRDLGYLYEDWVKHKKAHAYVVDSQPVTPEVARELGKPIEWLIGGGMKGMAGNYLKDVAHARNAFRDRAHEARRP